LREKDWEELTPKEIDAEIERINKWAKARETMPEVDLQWELYQREVKEATDFNGVRRRVEKLLNDKALSKERRVEVVEALVRRYEQLKRDDSDLTQKRFLELFLKYDPKAGLKFAEELVDRKEGYNLHLAARIVFAAGDKAKARPILGRELADEARGWDWRDSLLLLLEDGTKESLAEAAKLFGNKAHKALLDSLLPFDPPTRPQVLARCAKAGLSEPYRFYREQLDDEKTAERYATEVATEFAKNDAEVKKIVADHPQAADQIPHLKKWLDAKLAGKK
jgi:hypothetical protein